MITGHSNLRADAGDKRRWFRQRLLGWYERNRRDLPWRQNRNPYGVWLSEIMLQQTRVAAVLGHYHKFLRRFFPGRELGAAQECSVVGGWWGLGHCPRGRRRRGAGA